MKNKPIRLNNYDASVLSCITQFGKTVGDYLRPELKKCSRDAQQIGMIILTGKTKRSKLSHIEAAQKLLQWHDICVSGRDYRFR